MTNPITVLRGTWGLGNHDVSQALGVSQRAVRQACDSHGEPAVYEAAERLHSFLTRRKARGAEDPAAWMSVPIVEGYTVTRWHIYAAGRSGLLEANADQRLGDLDMLAEFDLDWRANYWTSFTTVVAEDGHLSVRGKTYDEVRAQL